MNRSNISEQIICSPTAPRPGSQTGAHKQSSYLGVTHVSFRTRPRTRRSDSVRPRSRAEQKAKYIRHAPVTMDDDGSKIAPRSSLLICKEKRISPSWKPHSAVKVKPPSPKPYANACTSNL